MSKFKVCDVVVINTEMSTSIDYTLGEIGIVNSKRDLGFYRVKTDRSEEASFLAYLDEGFWVESTDIIKIGTL